LLLST